MIDLEPAIGLMRGRNGKRLHPEKARPTQDPNFLGGCMSVNMEITNSRWCSVLRAYNSHSRYVLCSSPIHVVPTITIDVINYIVSLKETVERVTISALRHCLLQLEYRDLGCFPEYSSRSVSDLQPCVVEFASNTTFLAGHHAGASGDWSRHRGLATANPMEYRHLGLHSCTDMLILRMICCRTRSLYITVLSKHRTGKFS
jgi:hypothetical protein